MACKKTEALLSSLVSIRIKILHSGIHPEDKDVFLDALDEAIRLSSNYCKPCKKKAIISTCEVSAGIISILEIFLHFLK